MATINQKTTIFKRYSAFLIGYCIVTVLWGAYVRISGSGNGCGEHWPLCEGVLIPHGALLKTWIEFFHRVKSGLFLFFICAQSFFAFRWYPRGHQVRKLCAASLLVTMVEALLGAALVLGNYVAADASFMRLLIMSLHLLNTLVLLAILTLIWDGADAQSAVIKLPSNRSAALIALFIFIAFTGAWAALSTTLAPPASLGSALAADFSPLSTLLIRLRIIHPIAAPVLGILLIMLYTSVHTPGARNQSRRILFVGVFTTHIIIGGMTLFLLSPLFLKLLHLCTADLSWCLLVLTSFSGSETPIKTV